MYEEPTNLQINYKSTNVKSMLFLEVNICIFVGGMRNKTKKIYVST